jgi:membrane fusion protein, multidrug efflux system
MYKFLIFAVLTVATVAGCERSPPAPQQARPVRTITVVRQTDGEIVSLTGQVRAKDQANLAFRLDGRMIARLVNVGDVLVPGQVVARLDSHNQENSLRSAQATLSAAEGVLTQARLTFGRQQQLLKDGWTPRAKFDEARQALQSAQAQVDSAQAQLRIAQNQLSYTTLTADGPGTVTSVGAEPGEVISAGKMVVQLARNGGLDAVFDVPEHLVRNGPRDPLVQISLTDDPSIKATGRVREVAPQADSATRTFQVKVAITNPPDGMRLGSTVTGRIRLTAPPGTQVPATAVTEANGRPAVWVVDPSSQTVSLRNVEIARYDATGVIVSRGLDGGEIVVTAGVQMLRPDQKVSLLGADL